MTVGRSDEGVGVALTTAVDMGGVGIVGVGDAVSVGTGSAPGVTSKAKPVP